MCIPKKVSYWSYCTFHIFSLLVSSRKWPSITSPSPLLQYRPVQRWACSVPSVSYIKRVGYKTENRRLLLVCNYTWGNDATGRADLGPMRSLANITKKKKPGQKTNWSRLCKQATLLKGTEVDVEVKLAFIQVERNIHIKVPHLISKFPKCSHLKIFFKLKHPTPTKKQRSFPNYF